MARGSKGSRPTHYIAVTAKVGKGRYEKGPYIGLWEGDDNNGPLYRGSVQGKYLDELDDFIKDFGADSISFAVFESRDDKGRRGRSRDRDEDRDNDRDRDRDSRSSRPSRSREDKDDDRGSRSSKRGNKKDADERDSRRSSRDDDDKGRGKGKDKGDWWDD